MGVGRKGSRRVDAGDGSIKVFLRIGALILIKTLQKVTIRVEVKRVKSLRLAFKRGSQVLPACLCTAQICP